MAHFRARHILEPYSKLIQFARILGVIGHRQVGKSTFIEAHSNEYVTLDDEATLERARKSASGFIGSLKGNRSAIDECQLVPELFPALKVKIGTSQRPGRYILSGSVRFSSRNAIRESLTGRIVNQELLPLVQTELGGESNSSAVLRLFGETALANSARDYDGIASLHRDRLKNLETYVTHGGLPGICFVRSDKTRKALLRDVLETILDRDVRLVYPTTVPYEQIRALCRQFAVHPLDPVNYQSIKRETGLSSATTQKLIRALEGVFLIRRIPLLGDDFRGEVFWFEDQLERHEFADDYTVQEVDWLGLFYRNVRAQFTYRVGEHADFFHYRTRGGARVPLVIQIMNRKIGFFVLQDASEIDRRKVASAESFLKKYENARVVFAVKNLRQSEILSERMAVLPLTSLLF